jgi:uncharacterized protein
VEDLFGLTNQAAEAGFAKLVITGGEPLIHPRREALLEALSDLRQAVKSAQIVLRTNLAYHLTLRLAEGLLSAVDEIVVSVDGDPTSHDAQRGTGTYARTIDNLRFLHHHSRRTSRQVRSKALPAAQISLAAALARANRGA